MSGAPEFSQVIPILRIFDVAKAREFYLGFLGLVVDWEQRFDGVAPLYMQVSRGKLRFHLSEHYGDGTPGSSVYVWMTGLDAFHAELNAKQYEYLRPGIEDAPWGARLMHVIDPFGNSIRFCEEKAPRAN